MFVLNGKPLALDAAFTHDGVQYPANWLRLASQEERAAIGIEEQSDPPVWDQRFYWGYAEDGSLIPKDLDDLKKLWKETTATTANTLLAPTDWYVVRETDTGIPCPAEIREWRQLIRDAASAKREAIDSAASVDDLAAYLTSGGEVIEDPETGETSVNAANAYSTWPIQPEVQSQQALDYRKFYDDLLVSGIYGVIRSKAVNNAAVLTACVEFIAAIGDAKAGRPNPPAIQVCIDLLCGAAGFTEEELMELGALMQSGGLDQVYTLPIA